jgi:hypothetical protein
MQFGVCKKFCCHLCISRWHKFTCAYTVPKFAYWVRDKTGTQNRVGYSKKVAYRDDLNSKLFLAHAQTTARPNFGVFRPFWGKKGSEKSDLFPTRKFFSAYRQCLIRLCPSLHSPHHRRPSLLRRQNCWGYNKERFGFASHPIKRGDLPPHWVFSDLPSHACTSPIQAALCS